MSITSDSDLPTKSVTSVAAWICIVVIISSVAACVIIAAFRSSGLSTITVTANDESSEPRDHNIPLIKQTEALPDYEITINTIDDRQINLGAKPNTSAKDGLTWKLPDPISTYDISSIRLTEQDKLLSDALAEVQPNDSSLVTGNYTFEFKTVRSFAVGLRSFFKTPIGIAITTGFTIAILLMIARFLPILPNFIV